MSVFAHAGHWLLQLVYAFPVLLVIGFIAYDRFKRRGESDGDAEPGPE